jgi:hypothetical protein
MTAQVVRHFLIATSAQFTVQFECLLVERLVFGDFRQFQDVVTTVLKLFLFILFFYCLILVFHVHLSMFAFESEVTFDASVQNTTNYSTNLFRHIDGHNLHRLVAQHRPTSLVGQFQRRYSVKKIQAWSFKYIYFF